MVVEKQQILYGSDVAAPTILRREGGGRKTDFPCNQFLEIDYQQDDSVRYMLGDLSDAAAKE